MADVNGPTLMANGRAPNCSLSYRQNIPYTYDNGCGYCDWKRLCDTQAYCNECCTNLGNTVFNAPGLNYCRMKVVSVTSINNHTGATIDIPKSSTV